MTEPIVWLNGAFVPLTEARVPVEDRGFQFADGVYEVVACFGGAFLDLDAHLARLERSLAALGIPAPTSRARLARLCKEVYARNPFEDAMIYIQITRGVAARAHAATPPRPTMLVMARALLPPDAHRWQKGVAAITLPDIRWRRCDIKSIALLANVLARREAEARGAYEAFWLDEHGHLLEGAATNAFAVIKGVLVTHPEGPRILGGITRNRVLHLARALGIPVSERPWSPLEPGVAEIFLTSTTNLVMPVVQLDGRQIGDGRPGPITRRLQAALADHVQQLRERARAAR